MEYTEVMQLIREVSKYGSVMGLDSIRDLMARLNSPEEQLKIIHVAGTNGKGSTCAFLSSVLVESGYTVGRFSTPDVFCYEEKFQINGENISRKSLCHYYNKVENVCRQMTEEGKPHPTLFEMETAVAICYAADKGCDFLLLEVGMGGKTDATNFVKKPLVSVLTAVSMDHMEYLGNTLEEIARMKAGIMKKGCPVVSTWQVKEVKAVFEKEAARLDCPFYYISEERYENVISNTKHSNFGKSDRIPERVLEENQDDFSFSWHGIPITLSMYACYQIQNAMTALQTIDVINEYEKEIRKNADLDVKEDADLDVKEDADLYVKEDADFTDGEKCDGPITAEHITAGIKKAVSPGRFTKIMDMPEFYIDGAHNPGAVAELVKTLQIRFWDYRKVFIIGVFKDKDYESMLRILSSIEAKIITVTLLPPRGLKAEILAETAQKYYPDVICAKSIGEAIEKAITYIGKEEIGGKEAPANIKDYNDKKGMILAFGSLSYLKEAVAVIENKESNKESNKER